jgi:hypothetical protein
VWRADSASRSLAQYRSGEVTFKYPTAFRITVNNRGTTFQLRSVSTSDYWQDTIRILRFDKRTHECDPPQNAEPNARDNRVIAGHSASAYSGEERAMNRYTKIKGYILETQRWCWSFELSRTGRPYQKLNWPSEEVKRLDRQSTQDSEKADAAFKMMLDSFVFRRER